ELVPDALQVIGLALAQQGELGEAAAIFRRLDQEAINRRAPVWRVRALSELGALERLRGDTAPLEQARVLAIETGAVSALASISLDLGWHQLSQPSLSEAEALIDEAIEAGRSFNLPMLGDALVARAARFALSNRPRDMRATIEEALRVAGDRPEIEASALA